MKRTWKLTHGGKLCIAHLYRKGELVKNIAVDFGVATCVVSQIAWSRGVKRRDKVHVRASQ